MSNCVSLRGARFQGGRPLTLQTTAVIHEAYLKIAARLTWQDENHFLAVASTAMRHVLVDAARARLAAKRDPGPSFFLSEPANGVDAELDRLGMALVELAAVDADLARLVDCRYFGGLTERETAETLGISDRTVRRRWIRARAWIHSAMAEN
jgi:RNA polymerase sigma factor (TIGR02999 family)